MTNQRIDSSHRNPVVTVLDDDASVREVLVNGLEREGYTVLSAKDYHQFIDIMMDCDAVLCDLVLPGENGLHALEWTREHYPLTPVIIMTGMPSYETAAEAMRLDAYDYLVKPIEREELLLTIERAIKHRQLILEKKQLEEENEAYRLHLERRVADQTQALRESEEFLVNLTNTMADAVFTVNLPDYRIEYVNQAVQDIFGYQPKEILGQSLAILYIDSSRFNTFKQQQTAAAAMGQTQVRFEESMRKKDGQFVWTEMVATFVRSDEGKLSQTICVVRDITQRSLLLGVVAHELRSPLSLIAGFSQAILRDVEEIDLESLTKYLKVIDDNAARMLKMVDELLDITKIHLGEVSLQLEFVDLHKLLRKHIDDYGYVSGKKNILFKETFPQSPFTCWCDPVKMGQVIANLIDNAIKFSDSNSTIEVIGKKQNEQIWIGIKDQGPGIKSEEVQHLFKKFSNIKISSKPTAGEKSSGLGLAICKKIVEAHQGEIGVDSEPGKGSTFWFTIPVNG